MTLRWTEDASRQLEEISRRIEEDNPDAAFRVVNEIFQRIELLREFPYRGRPGSEPGTRELIMTPLPYLAVYQIRESVVEVVAIWHGAQSRRFRSGISALQN